MAAPRSTWADTPSLAPQPAPTRSFGALRRLSNWFTFRANSRQGGTKPAGVSTSGLLTFRDAHHKEPARPGWLTAVLGTGSGSAPREVASTPAARHSTSWHQAGPRERVVGSVCVSFTTVRSVHQRSPDTRWQFTDGGGRWRTVVRSTRKRVKAPPCGKVNTRRGDCTQKDCTYHVRMEGPVGSDAADSARALARARPAVL
jgi:hypothetical protein